VPANGKGSSAQLNKILKAIEEFDYSRANTDQAFAYLFYSLINAANTILNARSFKNALQSASFLDMLKGLEILLNKIGELHQWSQMMSAGPETESIPIEIRRRVTELEEVRRQFGSSSKLIDSGEST
jgi:hypothetical protein